MVSLRMSLTTRQRWEPSSVAIDTPVDRLTSLARPVIVNLWRSYIPPRFFFVPLDRFWRDFLRHVEYTEMIDATLILVFSRFLLRRERPRSRSSERLVGFFSSHCPRTSWRTSSFFHLVLGLPTPTTIRLGRQPTTAKRRHE